MKKTVALLLALLLSLSVLLVSCGGNSSNNGGNENGGDFFPEGEGDENGGENGSEGGGNTSTEPVYIENGDIIALSHSRLENADLSFNFSFDFGEEESDESVRSSNASYKLTGASSDYDTLVISKEDCSVPELYNDYFSGEEIYLDTLSQSARALADYMIERITVMDTVVSEMDSRYILSYDRESDTLTAIMYMYENGELSSYAKVKIYYDEEGDETVEMWSGSYSDMESNTQYVFYTAGKRYEISRAVSFMFEGERLTDYYTTSAIKLDGKWNALRTFFSRNNPLISKEGEYDFGNGLLFLEYLIETENNVYMFNDNLRPYRDGGELWTGVPAEEGDEIRIIPWLVLAPGFTYEDGYFIVSTDILDGWSRIVITMDEEYEIEYNPDIRDFFFNSENDYLLLEGGFRLTVGTVWNKDEGWGTLFDDEGTLYFVNMDDERFLIDDSFPVVTFTSTHSYGNRAEGTIEEGTLLYLDTISTTDTFAKQFEILNDFFTYSELSFIDEMDEGFLTELRSLLENKEGYTNKLFTGLCGTEYTFDGYKSAVLAIADELDGAKESFLELVSTYGNEVDISEIPERPSDLALIELGSQLTGTGTLTEDGFNTEGMSATVNKASIFSEGAEYTIIVMLDSGSTQVLLDLFSTDTYQHGQMTFTGKSCALPELELGEYALKAFLARQNENGYVRISEVIPLLLTMNEEISYQIQLEGGYNEITYENNGLYISASVRYVDTTPPEVTVDGLTPIGAEVPAYELTEGMTYADVLTHISIYDTHEGELTATLSGFVSLRDGFASEMPSANATVSVGRHSFYARDSFGNETEIIFVMPSPFEGEPEQEQQQ